MVAGAALNCELLKSKALSTPTSVMLFCEFDSLVGYRTTEKEG